MQGERNDYRNNVEQHKEIQLELSILDTKIEILEKEIIKFKIHLFYFLLFLQVIIYPLVRWAMAELFP